MTHRHDTLDADHLARVQRVKQAIRTLEVDGALLIEAPMRYAGMSYDEAAIQAGEAGDQVTSSFYWRLAWLWTRLLAREYYTDTPARAGEPTDEVTK